MIKKVRCVKKLGGEITIPSDKSISHRAVILSSIAKGQTVASNFSGGADCHSTLELFKSLGIDIQFLNDNTLKINGGKLTPSVSGIYSCGNSGTTMRLVAGILAGQNFNSTLIGDESLSKRPMKRIIEPLTQMGAEIQSNDGRAPLKIIGHKLHGIDFESKISSAQVKSCVLLAGLKAEGRTTYVEPNMSRNHTELMLKYLGANIQTEQNKIIIYPSEPEAKDIEVVGDISSAAFFIVAGLIVPNSEIIIKNVGINPTRTGILDVVQRMGGDIGLINERTVSGEKCADIKVRYTDFLKGCVIEGEDIPRLIDELPVIAVLASQAEGETVVRDAEDLRNKESDRISCLVNELKKTGLDIEETPDGFVVRKSKLTGDAELESFHDHRLAMSFYIAGLVCEKEIAINGFEWTKISFPEFENLFNSLV